MATYTATRKRAVTLDEIAVQLRAIQSQLGKFLLLIPEESVKEYKNASKIRDAYLRALKAFPAK